MHVSKLKMMQAKRHLPFIVLFCFCLSFCCCIDVTTISEESSEVENAPAITTDSNFLFDSSISPAINNTTVLPITSIVSEDTTSSSVISSTRSVTDNTTPSTNSLNNLKVTTTTQPKTNVSEVLQKWLNIENGTKILAKQAIKNLLPSLMEGTGDMNISTSCSRDILKLIGGLRSIKTWAFSFVDASGKIIDGLLGGTLSSIGDYDQCVNTKAINDRRGKHYGEVMFTGQYCSLDVKPPLPPKQRYYKLNDVVEELKDFAAGDNIINEAAKAAQFFHFIAMRIGICVPSGCQPSDIQQVVDKIANRSHWSVNVKRCEVKQEYEYTPLIIGVMTSMCFFGFLLCVGSLVDLYYKYSKKKTTNVFLQILLCFSLITNFKKLVNTRSSDTSMSCLHGFRFLSISWIVLGHTYLNVNYAILGGLRRSIDFQRDFFFQAVVNASVAVDTFFFISGFLVCYVTVKLVRDQGKPFNLFLYIFHRVLRLLPVYIMVILFVFLAPILGSGAIYHETIDPQIEACAKNWWTNVLFVNNFVNTQQICLPQSWYVSCDMQLYIAALIVLLPILRWPWVGLSIASLGILASVAGTIFMTYIYDYPPTMLFVHPDMDQRLAYWANAYFKPYSHAGPYCMGLIAGYMLITHPKMKFSMPVRIVGWLVAITSNMAVLYGVYDWNRGRDAELVETLMYSGLHRIAWTFGIGWIVINCATGQGGVVNYILSWKCWIPLGRLTYAIYLIHPIVQIAAVGNVRMRPQTSHYVAVWFYFGHMIATTGSSFAASMLVEAPFMGLEKIIVTSLFGKPKSSSNGHAPITNGTTSPNSLNRADQGDEPPVSHL